MYPIVQCQDNPCRASLVSLDGESFLLPQYDNDNKRKFIADDNTYILALDGDTDFHPKAVILLVDRSVTVKSTYRCTLSSIISQDWDIVIFQHKLLILLKCQSPVLPVCHSTCSDNCCLVTVIKKLCCLTG